MSSKKIRIGIDVGGTFTHAVAVEHQSYKLIAHAVTPTTHSSQYSVSEGIIKTFNDVLEQTGASPQDVAFVAHSTTQATNALLEGDVAKVGVIGMGRGLEAVRAKTDTDIKDIELSKGKYLYTSCHYINSEGDSFTEKSIAETILKLKDQGCEVIVASEAFSVDDASNEDLVTTCARNHKMPATASHEISQLYGLKVRTRTAVINASILPKMTSTADLTLQSIQSSGIQSPLMIMRSDGGVMDISQMKKRPILTLLSGPAAGIAAALMFARVSDGIFLEIGGTSTDISAIKNGKAMLKSANVGGHSTFLKTLDSRTVGVGGGSMVRVNEQGHIIDVGPRSAHIAGLRYLAFADEADIEDAVPVFTRPFEADPSDYLVMQNTQGKQFAITLTDAAIYAGMVKEGDYAFGNLNNVKKCFATIASYFKIEALDFAHQILTKAAMTVSNVVNDLISEYEMDSSLISLVGGGGGCTTLVPWLSKQMDISYFIADKAEVISAIGAAMAMLRDTIAKTVVNPSTEDIATIRRQAIDSLLSMGADANSVEVQIEIDQQKNILQATATGSIHMENQEFGAEPASSDELNLKAAESLKVDIQNVKEENSTDGLLVYSCTLTEKKLFGLIKTTQKNVRVLDKYAVVKLQVNNADIFNIKAKNVAYLESYIESVSVFNDAGQILPEVFIVYGNKIADFTSILEPAQMMALINIELEGIDPEQTVIMITHKR